MDDAKRGKMSSLPVSSSNKPDKRGLHAEKLYIYNFPKSHFQHVDRKRECEKYLHADTFSNMDPNLKESANTLAKFSPLPNFRANVSIYRHFESITCNTFSRQIAEIVGLDRSRISRITSNMQMHKGGKSATEADKRRKLTEKDRIAISRHLLGGEGQKEVAKAFGVSRLGVKCVYRRAISEIVEKFGTELSDLVRREYESGLTPETIADSIMLKTDELLSRLPHVQRERAIGILDEASRIRLDAKKFEHSNFFEGDSGCVARKKTGRVVK